MSNAEKFPRLIPRALYDSYYRLTMRESALRLGADLALNGLRLRQMVAKIVYDLTQLLLQLGIVG